MAVTTLDGGLALAWTGDLFYVFVAQSAALAAFGLINAGAIALGAWNARPPTLKSP